MSTIEKNILSGSTNGKPILVAGTNTGTADTIHTAVSGTTDFDEVWLTVDNSSASAVLLTIEWGGTSDPGNIIEQNIPGLGTASTDGLKFVVPGLLIQNAKVIKAFAGTTNVLKINGYIHEIRK